MQLRAGGAYLILVWTYEKIQMHTFFNSRIADFQKDLTFLCQKLVPTILYVSVSSAGPATMTNSLAALLQTP